MKPIQSMLLLLIFSLGGAYAMDFKLKSTDFIDNGLIPISYTCDGQNINPQLSWVDPPGNTRSFALIVADPDAPAGTWYHWVLYNIPDTLSQIDAKLDKLPAGILPGKNSWNKPIYQGPCPPDGKHRYIFTLYALDRVLTEPAGLSVSGLQQAMKGHILGEAQLIGEYERQK